MSSDYEKFLLNEAESDDLEQRARAYWHLAEYSLHQTELNRALAYNESAQTNYKNAGDSDGIGEARIQHARILAAFGQLDEAIEELDSCSLEERANPSQAKLAKIVSIEGGLYFENGETEKAIDCFKSSIELFKSEEEADEVLRVSVQLSYLLRTLDRDLEALDVIENAQPATENHDDARSVAEFELERGRVLTKLDRRDDAIRVLEGAKASFEFLELPARAHITQAVIAKAHNRFGEYAQALELCSSVQAELVEVSRVNLNAAKLRLRFFYEEAYAHFSLNNIDTAKKIASDNLKVSRTLGRIGVQVRFLRLLATIAEIEGQEDVAERHYREALEVNAKREMPRKCRTIKMNLANILVGNGANQEAIDLLESFDIYSWPKGNFENRQLYFAFLMVAYFQLDNLQQGYLLAKLVLENAIVEGAVSEAAMTAHDTLADVNSHWGKADEAREHGLKALGMAVELELQPVAQRLSKRWLS